MVSDKIAFSCEDIPAGYGSCGGMAFKSRLDNGAYIIINVTKSGSDAEALVLLSSLVETTAGCRERRVYRGEMCIPQDQDGRFKQPPNRRHFKAEPLTGRSPPYCGLTHGIDGFINDAARRRKRRVGIKRCCIKHMRISRRLERRCIAALITLIAPFDLVDDGVE